jgi:hypothetical protein
MTEDSAIAVMRTEQQDGSHKTWRISLIRLERSREIWTETGVRTLLTWAEHDQLKRDGTLAVYLHVSELEQDQQLEILARFKLLYMCCGGGETEKRTLVILNNDPDLSEAAFVDLDARNYHSSVTGREQFTDRNGDRHSDLVIARTDRFEDSVTHDEITYLWDPSSDQFSEAKRLVGDDCHCE